MTEGFQTVLAASEEERRDLFVGAADRLRTNEQNIKKDFWVCWTLDALFNELEAGGPRLLFKGGTSLSKGYGLIERFSEDIGATVFREDIGQPATVKELEALSGKKRTARLEAIKAACQTYIQGPMLERSSALLRQTLQAANLNADRARVEADPDDPDGQSLLLWYPTATAEGNAYIRRAIKIESGAKSGLDPHAPVVVKPYIADHLTEAEFSEVEAAAVNAGKKVAEWLREAALAHARANAGEQTDPILLAEIMGMRALMLNLFARASEGPLTTEDLRKMSAYSDSIKEQKAKEFMARRLRRSSIKSTVKPE